VQSVDPFGAKLWVKNPGGAILRSESNGVPSAISLKAAGPSSDSAMLRARGLETHPAGSAGKLSRPATVKLLAFPPASAAQRWLKSVVASNGFCPRGMILPLAGEIGD